MKLYADSPFLQDPAWASLISHSSFSTKLFATTFLPSYFSRPFAKITDQIFEAIDGPAQKVVIAAPRGWGKSSIDGLAFPARNICYRLKSFIVHVSNTADDAMIKARNLKHALVTNDTQRGDIIPTVFGDLRGEPWGEKQFKAGDTFILPRGAGQQIRGLNFGGNRPDLIIVDDLEDAEAVMNEERRAKLKQWFFADLMNSVDRSSDNWKVVVIGTILHEAALLTQLLQDDTWQRISISLCGDDLKSNWPEYMSDEKVEELFTSYLNQGQADTFAREYQNRPISGLDAVFKSTYFKYYEPKALLHISAGAESRGAASSSEWQDGRELESQEGRALQLSQRELDEIFFVTIVDPAKTVKLSSDDSAVITVGIDLIGHRIFFHDCTAGKMHPDELLDAMFEHVRLHNSRILAVEVTSLDEFIVQPVKNEMRRRNLHPQLVELKARDKKENRVAALAPYYRLGYIYHNKAVSRKLESQLTSFPRSELWDVMDAFAYIIEVMELDERYFYAEELPEENEFSEVMDSQYEKLEFGVA